MATQFTASDLEQLSEKGISQAAVEQQLERFRTGFPYLTIVSPSSVGNGILPVDDELKKSAQERWQRFLDQGGDVLKFVPASGAASRMFKALFAFVNGDAEQASDGTPARQVVDNIADFAFYGELKNVTEKLYGLTPEQLAQQGRHKDLIGAIILPEGLNYGNLPKALLTFHRAADGQVRTALEEQLAEGAQTAAAKGGKVRLHFTVSAAHRDMFNKKLEEAIPRMEKLYGVKYDVTISEQKPSTDTIAVTPDNELFRDDNGRLVFRPGGHGALIENLTDIDASVVFIKNIDNVVSDSHRADTIAWKRILGGFLLIARDNIESLVSSLATDPDEAAVTRATAFVNGILSTESASLAPELPLGQRRDALLSILDRPLRVCGMVRNEGEPGGGPYNVLSTDGTYMSPQILESTQIDLSKPENVEMMKGAGYFNPVDLVCYLRYTDGSSYDLRKYVDPATGFISEKSLGGRDLRALELPGLWNGAMSHWNTIFIEVPASTFNPVKTVNDLLRPAHQ